MKIKLKYKDTAIEVLEGDIVKVPYNDKTYTIHGVQKSDYSLDFGTAYIINNNTRLQSYIHR